MPESQLSELIERIKTDDELKRELQSASDVKSAAAIAKNAGFNISEEDFAAYLKRSTVELTDNDLEKVAGGKGSPEQTKNDNHDGGCTNTGVDRCQSVCRLG